ncbi:restriction endonuclease subunit S [Shewanella indica]|uniref:restriction endonuclease subunit S n=1 Tax=Shewanella indica TaxID=768528 RepID=UPI001F24CD48|nr:restriction endonuclease subunit S [Shewanella indica]MCE9792826.1 restriction endonuclease subunit S [Shewanella indica]
MSFETATLDSLCELVVDCPHSTPKWTDEGIIVLRNQNIKNGVLDLSAPSFTNEEDYQKRIKRAAPKAGDIVFTREAPMGEVCMIPEGLKCCLGQRQVLLRPKSDVNGQYLFWALQSPYVQQQIAWNEGTGSTVSNVRIPVLKALNIPRIGNEDMVAKSLSDIASKMALNTQTNQTLEQMAQAIFKSWFVDFDPVKAKMNGEQPEGMDAATASLFPDKLVESELGLIPEGWEVCLLNQKSEIKYGKNLPKTKLLDEGYPVFGGNGVIGYYSSYLYEDEQVLVSCRGAASGKVLRSLPKSFITNNSLVIDLSNSVLNINYVEPYLKGCNLEEYTSGSAQPQMTVANMAPVQILVPSEDILKSFDEVVKPLKSKIRANERQNLSLAALRDTLLPKLLSGEIELGTSEELVEAI